MARTNRTVQNLVKLESPTRRSEGSTQGTETQLDPGCTYSRFSLALIRHPAEPPYTGDRVVDRASVIVPFLHQLLAHEPSECFGALFLTARRHPIGHAIPFRGTLSQCRVEPRQLLVMALAVIFEGTAWLMARKEFSRQKGSRGYLQAVRRSKDPATFVVLFEDSAALAGLLAAFLGVWLGGKLYDTTGSYDVVWWLGVALGIIGGAWLGLHYDREGWLGGYGALRRRLIRLGHIALIALGLLNILFCKERHAIVIYYALSLPRDVPCRPTYRRVTRHTADHLPRRRRRAW